jgi:type I restriction-modification system DNA methylase subunit
MDATGTFYDLLSELDLHDSSEYVSADSRNVRPQDYHFLDWGRDKIRAEGVMLQRIPVNDSSYPLAYFRRLEDDRPSSMAEAHRLAWNMGRAPLLFLVTAGRIYVYSTYDHPRRQRRGDSLDDRAGLIDTIDLIANVEKARQLLKRYRREELLSGRFWEWEETRRRFKPNTRIERSLLDNLSAIRSLLVEKESLAPQIVHNLLGRSIFIQYLQDRKDSQGYSAFPPDYFERFLAGAKSFPDVLSDKRATYSLFETLEDKFNGDIFPLTGVERDAVQDTQLGLLSQFLRGKMDVRNRQLSFWPYYSFDAIPIEFISNMYEEFFHYEREEQETDHRNVKEHFRGKGDKRGTFYTPQRLVQFVLDEVLPWEGVNSQVRILDPACGSGIFLVEAYRRLVSRWRQANPDTRLDFGTLKRLATDNLYGVDENPQAIRVASFSLCLAMCDYLEPRYVWANVKFPSLQGRNLCTRDFFEFLASSPTDLGSFDLVVGNPPWESQLSSHAQTYLRQRGRPVGDQQIAQAFLWAAPEFSKKDVGRICMVAPSKGLLFNASGPNREFRKQFLETFRITTIVNFASLRKNLFAKAVGPAAPIIYEPVEPSEDHTIVYCCPKPMNSAEDGWHYVIENHDICRIPWREAVKSDQIWKTAMWGGPRDWGLVSRLTGLPNLNSLAEANGWAHGEGFIVGEKERKPADWLTQKPFAAAEELAAFTIKEDILPKLTETSFTEPRSRNRRIFEGPHILVRQSPMAEGFTSSLLKDSTVFNHSVLGISCSGRSRDIGKLGAICVAFGTNVCTYFAMMTSSRWLVERDELDKGEIMRFPLPHSLVDGDLDIPFAQLKEATGSTHARKKLIHTITKAYGLSEIDEVLINDAVTSTLDYFRYGANAEAAKPTDESSLRKYAAMFSDILRGSFGQSRESGFSSRFYMGNSPLIVLEVLLSQGNTRPEVLFHHTDDELSAILASVDRVLLDEYSTGVYVRRDIHVYRKDPGSVLIAKRNQKRLWTQSAAMRDADEVYGEIMRAWAERAWK